MSEKEIEDDDFYQVPVLLLPGWVYIVYLEYSNILGCFQDFYKGYDQWNKPNNFSDFLHNGNGNDDDCSNVYAEVKRSGWIQEYIRYII